MSALSNAYETNAINHLLRATAYTPVGTLYVGLFTSDPGESGVTGEVSGGSYARATITNNSGAWSSTNTSGVLVRRNTGIIQFPEATAAWGLVTHWAIYESAIGGSDIMVAHGVFTTPKQISIGATPRITAAQLSISFNSLSGTGLSLYAQTKLLELIFGSVAFTTPAAVYAALGTGSTQTFTEWNDAGYARTAVTFAAPTDGVTSNSGALTLNSSVISNTGPLTTFRVFDASTAGSELVKGVLSSATTVAVGNSAKMAAGSISISLA